MSTATALPVRRPALPAGHTLQGKAFKGSFGKSTVIAALTSAHGGDPRIRIYTLKGKSMKSVSSEQSVAECAAKIALHDASAQPEPAPTPTRKRKASKRKGKGASKKAQPSLGRGEKAAEASLDAAMRPSQLSDTPTLEDGENNFGFYARCVAMGMTRKEAAAEYRNQVAARKQAESRK